MERQFSTGQVGNVLCQAATVCLKALRETNFVCVRRRRNKNLPNMCHVTSEIHSNTSELVGHVKKFLLNRQSKKKTKGKVLLGATTNLTFRGAKEISENVCVLLQGWVGPGRPGYQSPGGETCS